jgi:hypothetical protein
METAEPVVSQPSAFEAEMSIKSPGTDQIPAEFIKVTG